MSMIPVGRKSLKFSRSIQNNINHDIELFRPKISTLSLEESMFRNTVFALHYTELRELVSWCRKSSNSHQSFFRYSNIALAVCWMAQHHCDILWIIISNYTSRGLVIRIRNLRKIAYNAAYSQNYSRSFFCSFQCFFIFTNVHMWKPHGNEKDTPASLKLLHEILIHQAPN